MQNSMPITVMAEIEIGSKKGEVQYGGRSFLQM